MHCFKHEYSTKPARKFSCLFYWHKVSLLDLLGTDHNEQFPVYVIVNWWNAYPFVFSLLSTCGHPAITDTPIIRTAAKSRAKINYRRLTEINSWYYGLSLMRTLTQDPYSIRYKVRSFRCIGHYRKIPPPQPHPIPLPEELKVKKFIAFGRRKNITFNLTRSPDLTKAK